MLHPSYTEILEKINHESEENNTPEVDSRYSIVIATSKRAREIIAGGDPYVPYKEDEKPLSIAVKELYDSKIVIYPESEEDDELLFDGEDIEEIEEIEEL